MWLALAVAVLGGIGSFNVPALYRSVKHGVASHATIIEILPMDHNRVRYEYLIGSRSFRGAMQAWPPNPDIENLKVGQKVVIYYDREHPEKSVLGEPSTMLENELGSVALLALIVPTFVVVPFWWRSRR